LAGMSARISSRSANSRAGLARAACTGDRAGVFFSRNSQIAVVESDAWRPCRECAWMRFRSYTDSPGHFRPHGFLEPATWISAVRARGEGREWGYPSGGRRSRNRSPGRKRREAAHRGRQRLGFGRAIRRKWSGIEPICVAVSLKHGDMVSLIVFILGHSLARPPDIWTIG